MIVANSRIFAVFRREFGVSHFSIIGNSYEVVKGRIRFAQVKYALGVIASAAYHDFTSSPTNDWADTEMPVDAPSFVGPTKSLNKWPQPPCPKWSYSWDNYYGVEDVKAVRITVRRGDLSSIWSFCLQNYGGNCQGDDGYGGSPPEISTTNNKYVYCNE